jgi:anti-sigma factor RsiW
MNCHEAREWMNALLDGELDAKNEMEVRQHLAGCAGCMQRYRSLEALRAGMKRSGLRHEMPAWLGARIAREFASAGVSAAPAPSRTRWLLWAGWPVAAAASALLLVSFFQQRANFGNEIVAVHVRSLLASHLNDVMSSDHHTVKPWFAGKLDFAPPVLELSAQGFDLEGGRLEYLDHQNAAALVYRRHGHVINLLVRLPSAGNTSLPRASVRAGYSLRSWQGNGLEFIAISDCEPRELEAFEQAYVAALHAS